MTRNYSEPATKRCIETDCDEPAGTPWGPHWCARHDLLRLDRIRRQLSELQAEMHCSVSPSEDLTP